MGERQGSLENVVMSLGFWDGKSIFVTGHTGFKGGWLCTWLKELGAQVTGYSLAPSTHPSLFEAAGVADGMRSIIGDVRDFEGLGAALAQSNAEVVFHLAAQPLVRRSYREPRETYETNVMGTVNLLDALRGLPNVRAAVMVTSDKCYENREWLWGYRESEPMGGYDPYSNSKGCAELVTAAFRSSFFNSEGDARKRAGIASARAGNVIGGGDWAEDRLLPDMFRAISKGRALEVRRPQAIRPWQHVLDPLHGYLMLAERLWADAPRFSSAWNFGPADSEARPVSWIADRLVALWGDGAQWTARPDGAVHEATYLKLDSSKARGLLEWSPRLSLDEALEYAVEWHRAFDAGRNMTEFTRRQIEAYAARSA